MSDRHGDGEMDLGKEVESDGDDGSPRAAEKPTGEEGLKILPLSSVRRLRSDVKSNTFSARSIPYGKRDSQYEFGTQFLFSWRRRKVDEGGKKRHQGSLQSLLVDSEEAFPLPLAVDLGPGEFFLAMAWHLSQLDLEDQLALPELVVPIPALDTGGTDEYYRLRIPANEYANIDKPLCWLCEKGRLDDGKGHPLPYTKDLELYRTLAVQVVRTLDNLWSSHPRTRDGASMRPGSTIDPSPAQIAREAAKGVLDIVITNMMPDVLGPMVRRVDGRPACLRESRHGDEYEDLWIPDNCESILGKYLDEYGNLLCLKPSAAKSGREAIETITKRRWCDTVFSSQPCEDTAKSQSQGCPPFFPGQLQAAPPALLTDSPDCWKKQMYEGPEEWHLRQRRLVLWHLLRGQVAAKEVSSDRFGLIRGEPPIALVKVFQRASWVLLVPEMLDELLVWLRSKYGLSGPADTRLDDDEIVAVADLDSRIVQSQCPIRLLRRYSWRVEEAGRLPGKEMWTVATELSLFHWALLLNIPRLMMLMVEVKQALEAAMAMALGQSRANCYDAYSIWQHQFLLSEDHKSTRHSALYLAAYSGALTTYNLQVQIGYRGFKQLLDALLFANHLTGKVTVGAVLLGKGDQVLVQQETFRKRDINSTIATDGRIQITLQEPIFIDKYTFVTGRDQPDRDPISWKLEGSSDGIHWVKLHQCSIFNTPMERDRALEWVILPKPPDAYSHFRFIPLKLRGTTSVCLTVRGPLSTLHQLDDSPDDFRREMCSVLHIAAECISDLALSEPFDPQRDTWKQTVTFDVWGVSPKTVRRHLTDLGDWGGVRVQEINYAVGANEDQGTSPLEVACQFGHVAVVETILDHIPDPWSSGGQEEVDAHDMTLILREQALSQPQVDEVAVAVYEHQLRRFHREPHVKSKLDVHGLRLFLQASVPFLIFVALVTSLAFVYTDNERAVWTTTSAQHVIDGSEYSPGHDFMQGGWQEALQDVDEVNVLKGWFGKAFLGKVVRGWDNSTGHGGEGGYPYEPGILGTFRLVGPIRVGKVQAKECEITGARFASYLRANHPGRETYPCYGDGDFISSGSQLVFPRTWHSFFVKDYLPEHTLFIHPLDVNYSTWPPTHVNLTKITTTDWINPATRLVAVQLVLYQPYVNRFVVVEVYFEILVQGMVYGWSRYTSVVVSVWDDVDLAQKILWCVLGVALLLFGTVEAHDIYQAIAKEVTGETCQMKGHFIRKERICKSIGHIFWHIGHFLSSWPFDDWNCVDVAIVGLIAASIGSFAHHVHRSNDLTDPNMLDVANRHFYPEFIDIARATDQVQLLLAFLVLFSWLKIPKYLTRLARVGPIVHAILSTITMEVGGFFMLLVIILVAFWLAMYTAFGNRNREMSSLVMSFLGTIKMAVGDWDDSPSYEDNTFLDRSAAVAFFIFMVFFVTIFFLNILIAVICEAYTNAREEGVYERDLTQMYLHGYLLQDRSSKWVWLMQAVGQLFLCDGNWSDNSRETWSDMVSPLGKKQYEDLRLQGLTAIGDLGILAVETVRMLRDLKQSTGLQLSEIKSRITNQYTPGSRVSVVKVDEHAEDLAGLVEIISPRGEEAMKASE